MALLTCQASPCCLSRPVVGWNHNVRKGKILSSTSPFRSSHEERTFSNSVVRGTRKYLGCNAYHRTRSNHPRLRQERQSNFVLYLSQILIASLASTTVNVHTLERTGIPLVRILALFPFMIKSSPYRVLNNTCFFC